MMQKPLFSLLVPVVHGLVHGVTRFGVVVKSCFWCVGVCGELEGTEFCGDRVEFWVRVWDGDYEGG